MQINRCDWCINSELEIKYHDNEWGVPLHDDNKLFEFMLLDAFQAGLSWKTILMKRENFRKAFDNFLPSIISNYNNNKINELMSDAGIIRNRLKIESSVTNAYLFLDIQAKFGTFDKFIWQFTDGKPIINYHKSLKEVPASTPISDKMSKELRKIGFKFVGTTICYAFMQASGMVNDHLITCYRHAELR